ncbi:MAG TPA: hypothetical protein VGQ65_24210 [Thermoanaerobaculia bacterium]|nr:hypothetical protein [Thermoanaerobaculia bacterium]
MPSKKTARSLPRHRASEYGRNVFINCPFDDEYTPIFEAIVFTIQACGFRPICARSRLNSSDVRLQKIVDLIALCRYSIHDLSRTELDRVSTLPRFNMPLELGIDIGCRAYGAGQRNKSFLIFDRDRFRFQTYVSDIAGQDIADHGNDPNTAIGRVRDWLRSEAKRTNIPGAKAMQARYGDFRKALPALCVRFELDISALTFDDFRFALGFWFTPTPAEPDL